MPHLAIKLSQADPKLSAAEIARILGISRQRVSALLKKYCISKICGNCYYSQDGSCSRRADIIKTPNKCPDWLPQRRYSSK